MSQCFMAEPDTLDAEGVEEMEAVVGSYMHKWGRS